jgi:hypothetical protein
LIPPFIRYAGVGAVGTAVHYGTLIALVQGLGANAVVASTAGFIVGAFVNYALNHQFTFASDRAHRVALPRFFCRGLLWTRAQRARHGGDPRRAAAPLPRRPDRGDRSRCWSRDFSPTAAGRSSDALPPLSRQWRGPAGVSEAAIGAGDA